MTDISDMDAAPVSEEDGAGPDNALKDSDARDDVGLRDKLQSPVEQDSDARDDVGLRDKLQSPVEQDSDAHIDVGLQHKLRSPAEQVAGEDTEWMKGLAPEVTRRIQRLQQIQSQKNELDEEINARQDEYEHALESLYTERSKIVNGEVDVGSNTYETAEEANLDEKATKVKGISDFWLTAMKNNEMLAKRITRRDEKPLKYLKDIKCCTFGDQLELKLDFYFDSNPYFKNSILTRRCREIDEPSTGTKIDWLPGKCLTEECDGFFHFFGGTDSIFVDDEDIRDILMYNIIPNAASWYTGKASKEDLDETESSDEEDVDETESSDEYSDETESSDEEDVDETDSDEYSDETEISEEQDVDDNEGDGEGSNKRTRVVKGPTARKRRLIR